jgi:ABC-type multidrug transport system ATPase subunit
MASRAFDEAISGQYGIKVKNLRKVYSDGVAAVDNTTFTVAKGEVLGLLGPNGAGKSTTFNMTTMALKRSNGGIKLMDQNIDGIDIKRHGREMGMVPQFNTIWEQLNVDETLNFIA